MPEKTSSDKSIFTKLLNYQSAIDAAFDELSDHKIIQRIWQHDFTVWKKSPGEITNRLGWLHCVENMRGSLAEIQSFAESVYNDGYTKVLLLGMGGSSLAPELFSNTFPASDRSLHLKVLDSTDPGAVLSQSNDLDLSKTLFIVSTKSGSTEETLSFFKYFYNLVVDRLGLENSGKHFVAITDPESKLVEIAQNYSFRYIFYGDPNIGGRYSALTSFGLVPAALCGVDTNLLLERAQSMVSHCSPTIPVRDNPAAMLGVILGKLAHQGRDKLTFIFSPQLNSFGDWVEQLIAESTGKQDKAIVPVIGERLSPPDAYGGDRLFIYIELLGDAADHDLVMDNLSALKDAGHPSVHIQISDLYDIAGQFFLWELATAIAGWRLQINPFDQPNVELAKIRARDLVRDYKTSNSLPVQSQMLETDNLSVFGNLSAESPVEAIIKLLSSARPGDYIAIHAYTQPTIETSAALDQLRRTLSAKTHLATTVGYGPRFLHSTGQLHKGDRGNGIFLQLTTLSRDDVSIPDQAGDPDSSITFGKLILAQALGDQQALDEQGRRVLRVHIKHKINDTILALADEISSQY